MLVTQLPHLTLQPECEVQSKISVDFVCVSFCLLHEQVVLKLSVMEEEGWRDRGCPPTPCIIKENKYLSSASKLCIREIHAAQRAM